MAERRMFAKTIIDSDAFLDMPLSTQSLYFHLSMRGDDDGFINNPRKIQKMIGASDDDLKLLIAKNFIIPFESGIVVIKHWKIHNYIRGDRKKETVYPEEMALLEEKDNGAYTLKEMHDDHLADICQTNVRQVTDKCQASDRQVTGKCPHRLGKERISKDNINNKAYSDVPELNAAIDGYVEYRKKIKKPMTDRAVELMLKKLYGMSADVNEQIEILNQSIMNGWQGIFPLKEQKAKAQVVGRLDDLDDVF